MTNKNNFITRLINAIPNKSNIICWTSLNYFDMIDIINLGVRFNCQNGKIIMLNQYEIILDYSEIDWRIKRWVYYENDKNTSDWSQDKKRIFLAKNKIHHTIIDQATFPREKVCGDGFTSEVQRVLKELDENIYQEFINASWVEPSYGNYVELANKKNIFFNFITY